jgi:hypothetical protein
LKSINFTSYSALNESVFTEYYAEYDELFNNERDAMDPYIFDLKNAINLIDEFGERLETLIWIKESVNLHDQIIHSPGRSDMCACERLFKCPNGTNSVTGASSWIDCQSSGNEILRRVNLVPPRYYDLTKPDFDPGLKKHLMNITDFWELGSETEGEFPIGTVLLEANDDATITVDLTKISHNLTYNKHYRFSVYVDCKPCPTRYQCSYSATSAPYCDSPSVAKQTENYNNCLNRYKRTSCILKSGLPVECSNSSVYERFQEPDLFKCDSIPFFCDDRYEKKKIWNILTDSKGVALPAADQEVIEERDD